MPMRQIVLVVSILLLAGCTDSPRHHTGHPHRGAPGPHRAAWHITRWTRVPHAYGGTRRRRATHPGHGDPSPHLTDPVSARTPDVRDHRRRSHVRTGAQRPIHAGPVRPTICVRGLGRRTGIAGGDHRRRPLMMALLRIYTAALEPESRQGGLCAKAGTPGESPESVRCIEDRLADSASAIAMP